MTYQNVGTPRFYIDIPTYLNSIGARTESHSSQIDFLNLNPNIQKPMIDMSDYFSTLFYSNIILDVDFKNICNPNKFFVALLNHNFGTHPDVKLDLTFWLSNLSAVLNAEGVGDFQFNNNGSSIIIGEHDPDKQYFRLLFDNADSLNFQLGCLAFGSYYDMPHSPELNINMDIINDVFKSMQTTGGSHLNNIKYNSAPMWERAD